MNNYLSHSIVSTLGPEKTNSFYAAKTFMEKNNIVGDLVLCENAAEPFNLLLEDIAQIAVYCNLYPDIHKLYLPNVAQVTVSDVFIHDSSMGLYKRRESIAIKTVAAQITASAFLHSDSFDIIDAPSNAEAASMCKIGKVDAAVSTQAAAMACNLVTVRDFGQFRVPYTVFTKRTV